MFTRNVLDGKGAVGRANSDVMNCKRRLFRHDVPSDRNVPSPPHLPIEDNLRRLGQTLIIAHIYTMGHNRTFDGRCYSYSFAGFPRSLCSGESHAPLTPLTTGEESKKGVDLLFLDDPYRVYVCIFFIP